MKDAPSAAVALPHFSHSVRISSAMFALLRLVRRVLVFLDRWGLPSARKVEARGPGANHRGRSCRPFAMTIRPTARGLRSRGVVAGPRCRAREPARHGGPVAPVAIAEAPLQTGFLQDQEGDLVDDEERRTPH